MSHTLSYTQNYTCRSKAHAAHGPNRPGVFEQEPNQRQQIQQASYELQYQFMQTENHRLLTSENLAAYRLRGLTNREAGEASHIETKSNNGLFLTSFHLFLPFP